MSERQSCNISIKRKKKKGSNISFVGEHNSCVLYSICFVSLSYHIVLSKENAIGNGKMKEKMSVIKGSNR